MVCDLTKESVSPIAKDTVGEISSKLIVKEPETKSPIEQMRENLTDYDLNIHECIQRGKQDIPGDFYVIVITKKERLMQNVMRNYFGFRLSCPTPDYDQTVYKYTREGDQVEFLWVIPDKQTCILLIEHRLEVPPEEYQLLQCVLRFATGDLMKTAKLLNGEL
jgi:hypothetical protein